MQVAIYSRKEAEFLLSANCFPKDVAVISFYDPVIRQIDQDYTHVNYGDACTRVFFSELDDLDIPCTGVKNQSYDLYFPEVDELAQFVYQAYNDGLDIICQCEYGQSRSAGCAAAILEHFYHTGISVFSDYKRCPNQLVYHKVFDALERFRKYEQRPYYYHAKPEYIMQQLAKCGAKAAWLETLRFTDKKSAIHAKEELEAFLQNHKLLCTNVTQAMTRFSQNRPVYLSLKITDFDCYFDLWCGPFKITSYQKYYCEKVPVVMWLGNLKAERSANRPFQFSPIDITECMVGEFNLLAYAVWNADEQQIYAVPLFVTNMR